MKLKRKFFCITDNYNKPDFRYLFEDQCEAAKKMRKIKNSTKGETIFLSKYKRDFFVDGIKRNVIHPKKSVAIKEGCWTTLKIKPLSLVSDIKPETFFKKVLVSKRHVSALKREKAFEIRKYAGAPCKTKSPFWAFDFHTSIFKTKAFAASFLLLCLATAGSVFAIHHNTANKINDILVDAQIKQTEKTVLAQAQVLENKAGVISQQFDEELDKLVLEALKDFENLKVEELEAEIRKIVAGSPMEQMAPLIAQQDRTVAAFLVGIAKKESNFGRRVPVLNGQDCFNYWGYRGIRKRMGSGGHTCFDSPQDAIDTVGGRLNRLVNADVDTPAEMVLWKCGSQCYKDPMAGKWISDVNLYFSQLDKDQS
jgi:hypothetical protein